MTKKECAIVMAYTGICMLKGEDIGIFYEYIAKLMERPVFSHELANEEICEAIKEKSLNDFLKLCKEAN